MSLTRRQQEILELIRHHLGETGYPPTRAEIASAFGFRSVNAAEEHLRALERQGAIQLQRGASRGIRLLPPFGTEEGLALVGRVAAGSPILALEHIEGYVRIDPSHFSPRADYLLRVQGESMRDAGILDRDLLAVHRTPVAENGQILVARLGEEVTVKRLRRLGHWRHRVELHAENPAFEPIILDLRSQELVIEGIGVGVLRSGLDKPGGGPGRPPEAQRLSLR